MTSQLLATPDARPNQDPDVPAFFGPRPAAVERLRFATICLALAVLTFAQNSGSAAADTKLDLVTDPVRFLTRALTLWDATGNAGQLQNQAYGYLFPMGPFFVLCHWLGLQAWVSQRLWESALVVFAFAGMVKLARLLGARGFWAPVAAGLVYSLAPQLLTELFTISAGLTPTVALPWVLLPLVRGAQTGSTRRAAAYSGVALLFAGGTNAAATLAILPVPALWLLTRQRGARRTLLIGNWLLAVLLSCAWWLIPLLLLGKYSPPFLNWIEAAANTTAPTSLAANLRGVEHWESYLGPGIWPAGWIFVSTGAAILGTTVVAAAGLAGLASRNQPNRVFLLSCLGLGLAILSIGHLAPVTGPFAGQLQALLDGPLVAFRNIHKFDPLIRLPIALGVGLLLSRTEAPWWRTVRPLGVTVRLPSRLLLASVAAAVALVSISPALGNRLVPEPRSGNIASWWQQAGSWLNANSHEVRTLVVPGAATPTYFWASTVDDALQPETDAPWVVRSSIPLAPAGAIRLLDAIDNRLDTGRRDDGLAALLTRSGIGFVLVRNDLNTVASLATPYNIVRSTLLSSPGFARVAGFGPQLGGGSSPAEVVDSGAGVPRPAIEIFRVGDPVSPVGLLPVSAAVAASGTSDDLPQLVDRGLPAQTPVLFGNDAAALGAAAVQVGTDGIRRQQAGFGNTLVKSATMTAGAPYVGSRAAYDYLPDNAGTLSTVTYHGIRNVTASSSGADVYAPFNRSPANGAFAAVDGDPSTAWRSASVTGAVRQWLQVDFDSALSAASMTVSFLPSQGQYPSQISVHTDRGNQLYPVAPTSAAQKFSLRPGKTSSLRITVRAMPDRSFGTSVAISELSIAGISAQRSMVVPVAGSPALLAFDAAPGYRDGCLQAGPQAACGDEELVAAGEEDAALDRQFVLNSARSYSATASFLLLANQRVAAQLDSGQPIKATASSVASADPRVRAGAAVDGEPNTTWSAAAGDLKPSLTLNLGATHTVRGLRIVTAPSAPTATPERVEVTAGTFRWTGELGTDGRLEFAAPISTSSLTITIERASLRRSTSTLTGHSRLLPVGIGTLSVDDGQPQPSTGAAARAVVHYGCADGLELLVDGRSVRMQLTALTAAVLAGESVQATACDQSSLRLDAGSHRLRLTGGAGVLPRSITLNDAANPVQLAVTAASPGTATISRWGDTDRRLQVATSAASFLVVRENFNAGWTARLGDSALKAVRLDGWQQAFVLPAGSRGTVTLSYAPQRIFSAGLVLGLLAVLALLGLAVLPAGRSPRTGGNGLAEPAALTEARLPWLAQVAGLAAVAGQTAGAPGLLTAAVVLAACQLLWPPAQRSMPAWIAALALVAAGVEIASANSINRFTVANSSLTQLLSLAAFVLAAAAGLPAWRRRST